MSACEKCWADAFDRMMSRADGRSQTEHYVELLKEREHHPCTPEEQAGERGGRAERTLP